MGTSRVLSFFAVRCTNSYDRIAYAPRSSRTLKNKSLTGSVLDTTGSTTLNEIVPARGKRRDASRQEAQDVRQPSCNFFRGFHIRYLHMFDVFSQYQYQCQHRFSGTWPAVSFFFTKTGTGSALSQCVAFVTGVGFVQF